MEEGSAWGLVTVIGPILFLLIVVWLIVRNKKRSAPSQVTEQATRELYREEDRAAKEADGQP